MTFGGTAKRLCALGAPTLTFDRAIIKAGAPSELVTIPCPSFLIEHAKGLVLFDTGPDPAAATNAADVYGEALVSAMGLRLTRDQCVDRQLEAVGYEPTDVKFVVASHMHFDHVGALYLFNRAKIFVGKGEIPWALWPNPAQAYAFRREDIDAVPRDAWHEVSGDYDIFGDGSVILLSTPGHTPGELSLLVRLPGETIILTGDTVHDHEQLQDLRALPSDANTEDAVNSLRRLRMLRDTRDAVIWIGHDPDDWAKFPHGPHWLE